MSPEVVSYIQRAKIWWAQSPVNPKNMTSEQLKQERWENRTLFAFTGGASIGLTLTNIAWWCVILILVISWPLIERDYKRKIERKEAEA